MGRFPPDIVHNKQKGHSFVITVKYTLCVHSMFIQDWINTLFADMLGPTPQNHLITYNTDSHNIIRAYVRAEDELASESIAARMRETCPELLTNGHCCVRIGVSRVDDEWMSAKQMASASPPV